MAQAKYEKWLEEDNLILLEAWARNGLTDKQIAKNMGIHTSTLYDWKNKHPEISESLKRGKEVTDILAENALYKSAIGFEYEEVKQIVTEAEKGNQNKRVEKTKKYYPPNVTALIFWLKNRKPKQWRDKKDIYNNEQRKQELAIKQAELDLEKTKAEIQRIRGIAEEIEDLEDIEEEIYGSKED